MKIGILGGGHVGQKMAALSHSAGHLVMVGHRDQAKAIAGAPWSNGTLQEAAAFGELVVVGVPFRVCADVLTPLAEFLAGKVVVDTTNPHKHDWSPLLLGEENSAGEEIARMLPRSDVVKAFNTIFADVMVPAKIDRGGRAATGLLCGDSPAAREAVAEFTASIGFAPLDAGPLLCSRYFEAMAHLNVQLAVRLGGGTDAAFIYDQRG